MMFAIAKNDEGLPVAILAELIIPTADEYLFLFKNTKDY